MTLLWHELRKIWNPIIVLLLVVLGGLYYFVFAEFFITHFNPGSNAQAAYDLSSEWVSKFGPTMDRDARATLDVQLADEKRQFAEFLQTSPEARKYHLTDWPSFRAFQEASFDTPRPKGSPVPDTEPAVWAIINHSNFFRIQTLKETIEAYDDLAKDLPPNLNYLPRGDGSSYDTAVLARVKAIKAGQGLYGYLPSHVFNNTHVYMNILAFWTILSVVLLVGPTFVRDRLYHTRAMQWSSRTGRPIIRTQLLAAGLSTLAVTVINIVVYMVPFLNHRASTFLDFGLFSFIGLAIPWVDITYGTYLAILVGMVLVVGVLAGALALFISQHSANYVSLLFTLVPLLVVLMYVVGEWLLWKALFIANPITQVLPNVGIEILILVVVTAASLMVCGLGARRSMCQELA